MVMSSNSSSTTPPQLPGSVTLSPNGTLRKPKDTLKKPRKSNGKHQMAACCACKHKRKKCDGKYPKCSTCERLNIDCTIIDPPTGRQIKRDYLESLEKKIEDLKSQLSLGNTFTTDATQTSSSPTPGSSNQEQLTSKSVDSPDNDSTLTKKYPPTYRKDLVQEVGYITLGAASEPRFIGPTSAYSIAKALTTSINSFSETSSHTAPLLSDGNRTKTNDMIIDTLQDAPYVKPSIQTACSFLTAYKDAVQCQYPFLDWEWIVQCFDRVMHYDSDDYESNFFVNMIFAVGAQLLEVKSKFISNSFKKSYYKKAFEYVEPIIEVASLRTVQAYLLMAVFSQKMPHGSSIWQTTGLAIRTAVALGLHREPYRSKKAILTQHVRDLEELKVRIFWSAYGMERINGLVLGRPFSIADLDIDCPFPTETEELKVASHVIKLRQIQSNICTFIYKPGNLISDETQEETRNQIILELNDWMATFPSKQDARSTFETDNWSCISYHNSILLLLRPAVLKVANFKEKSSANLLEWFKLYTQSASSICLNYKKMYLKGKLSYTWLAMHCCFVAGISFLYSIWLDSLIHILEFKRKSVIYDTINACSSVLYVFSERWPSAIMFRDSFERLSNTIKAELDPERNSKMNSPDDGNIFVKGSINFDPYLRFQNSGYANNAGNHILSPGLEEFNSNRQRLSIGEATDGLSFPSFKDSSSANNCYSSNLVADHVCSMNSDFISFWEFLNSTGDKFLRDHLTDMEENLPL